MYDTFERLPAICPSDSYNALAPWYPPSRPGPADAAPCRGGAFSFCSSKPHAGPAPRTPEAKGQVLSEAEYHRYTRLQSLTQEAETHIRALKHAERNIHADIHPHSVPAGIGEWAYWWEGDEGTGMAAGRDVLSAHREREQDVFTRLHRTKCRENVSERLSLLSRELPGLSQCSDLSDHLFANGRGWRIFACSLPSLSLFSSQALTPKQPRGSIWSNYDRSKETKKQQASAAKPSSAAAASRRAGASVPEPLLQPNIADTATALSFLCAPVTL